jgi:hypothetical protein
MDLLVAYHGLHEQIMGKLGSLRNYDLEIGG